MVGPSIICAKFKLVDFFPAEGPMNGTASASIFRSDSSLTLHERTQSVVRAINPESDRVAQQGARVAQELGLDALTSSHRMD